MCPPFYPLRITWIHKGFQGHAMWKVPSWASSSSPNGNMDHFQLQHQVNMCVGAFIMPSNDIKCKQWASWPLQGHQGLHQGFQVFIKSSMTTSSPLRGQGPLSHQIWVQGLLQGFFIKQEATWASSTTSTTQGDLQGSRSIMTSPVRLPNLWLAHSWALWPNPLHVYHLNVWQVLTICPIWLHVQHLTLSLGLPTLLLL